MRQTSMAAIAEVLRVLVIGDGRFAFLPYLGEAATASALTFCLIKNRSDETNNWNNNDNWNALMYREQT